METGDALASSALWQAIIDHYRCDESAYLTDICEKTSLTPEVQRDIVSRQHSD